MFLTSGGLFPNLNACISTRAIKSGSSTVSRIGCRVSEMRVAVFLRKSLHADGNSDKLSQSALSLPASSMSWSSKMAIGRRALAAAASCSERICAFFRRTVSAHIKANRTLIPITASSVEFGLRNARVTARERRSSWRCARGRVSIHRRPHCMRARLRRAVVAGRRRIAARETAKLLAARGSGAQNAACRSVLLIAFKPHRANAAEFRRCVHSSAADARTQIVRKECKPVKTSFTSRRQA
jgi:hypothetical protein